MKKKYTVYQTEQEIVAKIDRLRNQALALAVTASEMHELEKDNYMLAERLLAKIEQETNIDKAQRLEHKRTELIMKAEHARDEAIKATKSWRRIQ